MSTRGVKKAPPRVLSAPFSWTRSFCCGAAMSTMDRSPYAQGGVGATLFSPHGPVWLLSLDLDLARLGGLVLGELDHQHAVLEPGVHVVGVHREGQRQRADKT